MSLRIKPLKIKSMDLIAFLMMFLITAFPIFGQYGMMIQNIVLWLIGILFFVYMLFNGGFIINRIIFGYILYFAFGLISILWSSTVIGALIRLINMAQVILVGLFIVYYCREKKSLQKLLDYYVFGTVIISVYCFIQDISTLNSWIRIGRNAFEIAGQNQIYYSCILIYSMLIVLYRLFCSDKKIFYGVVFVFLYVCGALTAVRKCLVIPIVFVLVFVALKNRKNAIKFISSFILIIVLCLLVYYLISKYVPSMYSRIQSLISDIITNASGNSSGNSFEQRKWLREQAWIQFKNNPIIGVGIGQFRFYTEKLVYIHIIIF